MEMDNLDLDAPIMTFTDALGSSVFTFRHAFEGLIIFGALGSGKTSGSAQNFAIKYLSKGFGGVILTCKPDEKDSWIGYCRRTNRLKDLVIIEPGGKEYFNFLEYQSSQAGSGSSITSNLVHLLQTVIKAGEDKTGSRGDDNFWESALELLITSAIDLCIIAYGKLDIQTLYDIVQTAPKTTYEGQPTVNPQTKEVTAFDKAYQSAFKNIMKEIDSWEKKFTREQLRAKQEAGTYDEELYESVKSARTMKTVDQYFTITLRNLSDKVRSILDFSFSGFLFRLLQEPVYSLFCKRPSTVVPEDCLDGKIILLNIPVKVYHRAGRDMQIMFKYIWQLAMEKRDINKNGRPLFLWADEAQNFLHEYDTDYQATARSSRVSTVYITQNMPNLYACMGGAKYEHKIRALLGCMGTKTFHTNAEMTTNNFAAELIGQDYMKDYSRSETIASSPSMTRGESLKLEYKVRPEMLVGLRNGGKRNNYLVNALIHRQGEKFHNGENYLPVTFSQTF